MTSLSCPAAEEPRSEQDGLKEELVKALTEVLDKQTNTLQRLDTARALLKFDPKNTKASTVILQEGFFGDKISDGISKDAAHNRAVEIIRESIKTAPPALVAAMIVPSGTPKKSRAMRLSTCFLASTWRRFRNKGARPELTPGPRPGSV